MYGCIRQLSVVPSCLHQQYWNIVLLAAKMMDNTAPLVLRDGVAENDYVKLLVGGRIDLRRKALAHHVTGCGQNLIPYSQQRSVRTDRKHNML